MDIKNFKLIKNRQRPEQCFAYEKKTNNAKYSIFTMNGGKTYLASIEGKRMDGSFYPKKSNTVSNIDEALAFLA